MNILIQDLSLGVDIINAIESGILIALFFYFMGLSAGTFVISALYRIFGLEKHRHIAKSAAGLALIFIVTAPTLLFIDLKLFTISTAFSMFNPALVISWGTLIFIVFPIGFLLYAYYLLKDNLKMSKVFGIIGIPLAVGVHGYTGFVFGAVKTAAFWYPTLMLAYFLASAIVSSFGIVILINLIQKPKWVHNKESKHILGKMPILKYVRRG